MSSQLAPLLVQMAAVSCLGAFMSLAGNQESLALARQGAAVMAAGQLLFLKPPRLGQYQRRMFQKELCLAALAAIRGR
jgi:hypothetical protein